MDTIAAVVAKKLGKFLAKDFREIFGSSQNDEAERLGALARTTIECIARSDALYHTYEHTMLVTMVGRDILRGRTLAHLSESLRRRSQVRARLCKGHGAGVFHSGRTHARRC